MENEKRVEEICQESIAKIGPSLSEAIANAMFEGYKLGWEECLKKCGLERLIPKEDLND